MYTQHLCGGAADTNCTLSLSFFFAGIRFLDIDSLYSCFAQMDSERGVLHGFHGTWSWVSLPVTEESSTSMKRADVKECEANDEKKGSLVDHAKVDEPVTEESSTSMKRADVKDCEANDPKKRSLVDHAKVDQCKFVDSAAADASHSVSCASSASATTFQGTTAKSKPQRPLSLREMVHQYASDYNLSRRKAEEEVLGVKRPRQKPKWL